MKKYCLETSDLTYKFSNKEIAVRNINLHVPEGSIYGFIGPNGAGKTTTLRLILGLLKKQQGQISFFGKPFEQHRLEILKKVGSLIESPSLYGHLTAIENLRLLQKIYNCPDKRIQEVLNLVDLSNTGNKKSSRFSLGMKQRLSIAIALLHNPSFLILDEPTNGLDPNGILEIRGLLKRLNREEGVTILISSHLLSEIEKLVTDVGIINKGNLIFEGSLDDLMNKQKQTLSVYIETSNIAKTVEIMSSNNLISTLSDRGILMDNISKEKIAEINRQLVHNKIEVYGINRVKSDLESIFMDITNN
jgi:lantibiotic transport system ATP-binding protein